jgi:hypothetical protein
VTDEEIRFLAVGEPRRATSFDPALDQVAEGYRAVDERRRDQGAAAPMTEP